MKRIMAIAALVLAFTVSGCGVGMSKPSASKALEMAEKIRYVHDKRTNICYAMVSTSHQLQMSDDGMSMTYVPCSKEVLDLIAQ